MVGVALAVTVGTGGGAGWADTGSGVNATGTVQCSLAATITYKPAQFNGGTRRDKLSIKGTLSACTSTGTVTVLSGKVTGGSKGGVNDCAKPWNSPVTFTVKWRASRRINATKGALTSLTTFNNGSNVSFNANVVTSSGSYSGDTGTLSVVTTETSTQIANECTGSGLSSLDVTGSVSLS